MARMSGIPSLLGLLVLGGLAAAIAPAFAGEVSGRVTLPKPPVQASLGASGLGPEQIAPAREAEPVLVYVAEACGPLPRTPTANARLQIAGGRITPPLVAVGLMSVLEIANADRREHHLVSRGGPQGLDLGRQAPGSVCKLELVQTGVIPLECALHRDLSAEIIVLAHAAFTLVDAEGRYSLRDLPPGHATIVAYNRRYGEVSREVAVPASGQVELSFDF